MSAERALVDAVLAGTPGAFERLLSEYQGLCWHILHRLVRHPEDARDLCQETFLRVHQNLHQYRHESPLKHWIARVAYSIGLRHIERRRIEPGALPAGPEPLPLPELEGESFDFEAACDSERSARRLHAAIEKLPPVPRLVLGLYHLEEMSIPDIAQITHLPPGTIKSHLFRARLRLRELLETAPESPP